MAKDSLKLDYVAPVPNVPRTVQKSFGLDLNAGRNVKSLIVLLLIFVAGIAALFVIIGG